MKTGMQPAMMVSLRRRVLAESPGMDKQKVELRMRSMMLLRVNDFMSASIQIGLAGRDSTSLGANPAVVVLSLKLACVHARGLL